MTSSVKISAHCSAEKQVRVVVTDVSGVIEEFVLQDGETADRCFFDGRQVYTREELKADSPAAEV